MARSNESIPPLPRSVSEYLTVAECCTVARVCPRTVHRWIAEERFKSTRPIASGSGKRLVDRDSFERFIGIAS